MTVRAGAPAGCLHEARCSSHSFGYVIMLEAQTGSDIWIPVDPTQFVGQTHSPASHLAPHWHSTPWHKSITKKHTLVQTCGFQ